MTSGSFATWATTIARQNPVKSCWNSERLQSFFLPDAEEEKSFWALFCFGHCFAKVAAITEIQCQLSRERGSGNINNNDDNISCNDDGYNDANISCNDNDGNSNLGRAVDTRVSFFCCACVVESCWLDTRVVGKTWKVSWLNVNNWSEFEMVLIANGSEWSSCTPTQADVEALGDVTGELLEWQLWGPPDYLLATNEGINWEAVM